MDNFKALGTAMQKILNVDNTLIIISSKSQKALMAIL